MKIRALVFITLLFLCISCTPASAGDVKSEKHVVLIIMDRVTWPDIIKARTPNLRLLVKHGAGGLLSNRTAANKATDIRSYLTIGASARADGTAPIGAHLNQAEFKALVSLNKHTGYKAQVGLLGGVLRRNGVAIAAFGNADTFDTHRKVRIFGREAELIGIDERGRPVAGERSDRLLTENKLTDYTKIETAIDRSKAQFLIIETGDTRRADIARLDSGRSGTRLQKKKAIENADRFIGWVIRRFDPSSNLIVVISPTSPIRRNGDPGLAAPFVAIAGPDFNRGSFTSPSTRRPGLITSADIAPTIAGFFGADLGEKSGGRTAYAISGDSSFSRLAQETREYLLSEKMAIPIIVAYGWVESLVLALVVLSLIFAGSLVSRFYQAYRFVILLVLASSLGVFIAPLFAVSFLDVSWYVAMILAISFVIAAIAWRLPEKTFSPLIFMAGATTLFLIGNLIIGSPADGKSAFGYTIVTAGRFYGIGNHYAAVLLASALVFPFLWIEKTGIERRVVRLPIALFFGGIVFMVGFGGLGADTGGIIMMAPTFVLAYFGLTDRMAYWLRGIAAAVITAASLMVLAAVDALTGKPAHVGMAARQAYSGPPSGIALIIRRKIEASYATFNYTHWSWAVPAVVIILAILLVVRARKGLDWAGRRHSLIALALTSGTIGGIVGTLANDSGIAVMAVVMGYLIMTVLYLEVVEVERLSPGNETQA